MIGKRILLTTVVFIFVFVTSSRLSFPATQYEWKDYDRISVHVLSPKHNSYMPINYFQSLSATAMDPDCQRHKYDGEEWSDWYVIYDEVTSGTTSSDYHMWWTCGIGEIMEDFKYGTHAEYISPDYSDGSSIRIACISVYADDFNRGDESPTNRGHDDSQGCDSINLYIWQVTVSARQSGTVSSNYDGERFSVYAGGDQLGWVEYNNPTDCEQYAGNTELAGSIPSGPTWPGPGDYTDWKWSQFTKGYGRHKVSGGSNWIYDENDSDWTEEALGSYPAKDEDSRHNGSDVREIFLIDIPGFYGGEYNNQGILSPFYYVDLEYDFDFKTYIIKGETRVSNLCIWHVDFALTESGGVWTVNGSHSP